MLNSRERIRYEEWGGGWESDGDMVLNKYGKIVAPKTRRRTSETPEQPTKPAKLKLKKTILRYRISCSLSLCESIYIFYFLDSQESKGHRQEFK